MQSNIGGGMEAPRGKAKYLQTAPLETVSAPLWSTKLHITYETYENRKRRTNITTRKLERPKQRWKILRSVRPHAQREKPYRDGFILETLIIFSSRSK